MFYFFILCFVHNARREKRKNEKAEGGGIYGVREKEEEEGRKQLFSIYSYHARIII